MDIMDKLLDDLDRATEPSVMSKAAALEFLEQYASEVEARIAGLRDEIGEDA